MAARTTHTVVNISLSHPDWDHDRRVRFLGHQYRLVRVGAGGDVARACELARTWAAEADAIAVSGVRATPRDLDRVTAAAKTALTSTDRNRVPVTQGTHLAGILQEWALRRVQVDMPGYFANARTVVLGTGNHDRAVKVLREFTSNLTFADPGRQFAPDPHSPSVVDRLVGSWTWPYRALPGAVKAPLESAVERPAEAIGMEVARRAARTADVVVATYDELASFGLEELAGKTLVTNAITDERLAELASRGVDLVIDATPQPFEFPVVAATLEAMMAAPSGSDLSNDEMVALIEDSGLEPRLLTPNGPRRKSRFVFVIHPLSTQYFNNVKPIGAISRLPGMGTMVERAMAHIPPFVYSHVTGITSPTGAEAEGWLITVGGTPRQMLSHRPEFTYAQLLTAAEMARKLGAQIMGLGAFTKVVGDAGVTVAKKAPLPVTTGNSYSASGALWAAHDALLRLNLADVDEQGRLRGRAMVVGATGSIGSACARLLALASDELWLVSPETAKLLALKRDIEKEQPRATVHVADRPDEHLSDMDLIVTATSAAGQKVLDIMRVKPGCVITDVARPLDLSAEEVSKRPDVLVIESGEVELPGDVHMGDIGLPPKVAFACLAETIVLALEGRYETFTVGRQIEWPKVKEIYQLGLKHGMRLATISGVNGVFTDDDFDRVRTLALAARARKSVPTAAGKQTRGRRTPGAVTPAARTQAGAGARRTAGNSSRSAAGRRG